MKKFQFKFNALLSLLLFGFSEILFATGCGSIFQNAVQSTTTLSGAGINIVPGATIVNPTGVKSLNDDGGALFSNTGNVICTGAQVCVASGVPSEQLSVPNFPTMTGSVTPGGTICPNTPTTQYNTVTGGNFSTTGACAGLGTTFYINTISLANGSGVSLVPGDYFVNTFTATGAAPANRTVSVTGSTARMYVNNYTANNHAVLWNSGGTADQLLLVGYSTIQFNQKKDSFTGVIYSTTSVDIEQGSVDGAIAAPFAQVADTVTYDSAINNMNFGNVVCSAVSFTITVTGSLSPCSTITMTVQVNSPDGTVDKNYSNNITMTATQAGVGTTGTWNNGAGNQGSFSQPTPGSGVANYTFAGGGSGDKGLATFTYSYAGSSSNTINFQVDQTSVPTIVSNIATANPSGATSLTITANPVPSPVSGFTTTEPAGSNFNMNIVANSASCGIITSYSGVKSIKLWSSYIDPSSPAAGGENVLIQVNGAGGFNAIGKSLGTATAQNITFTNGVAAIAGNYKDVGKIALGAADAAVGGPSGSSGNFVVKPYTVVITSITNASNVANPGATSPSGAVFTTAGTAFTIQAEGREQGGTRTPSFGMESTSEQIKINFDSTQLLPTVASGGTGTLSSSNSNKLTLTGTPGVFSANTFAFSDVGIIGIYGNISSGSYLGTGQNIQSQQASTLVGRFIPFQFALSLLNTPQLAAVCPAGAGAGFSGGQGFTYLEQLFGFSSTTNAPKVRVTAQAQGGATTQNYTGNKTPSFKKLVASNFDTTKQVYSKDASMVTNSTLVFSTAPNPFELDNTVVSGLAGNLDYTFGVNATNTSTVQYLAFMRTTAGGAPDYTTNFSPLLSKVLMNVTATDSDGVTNTGGTPFQVGTTGTGIAYSAATDNNLYHGRLNILNAQGPEILALSVPTEVQYYTGTGFTRNLNDNCVSIGNTAWVLLTTPTGQTGVVTTATLPQPQFSQGLSSIVLSAPNATGQKNIEMNLSAGGANMVFLQYNWPFTAGNAFKDPQAQANFGYYNYKGSPKIIYQREQYQ